jgi:pimeloyl-ACP methyl ester carboxylesterase
MRSLVFVVVLIGTLWVLVLWMQPRMAFFPFRGIQETPASAGLPYSDVEIVTSDGVMLHGWWLEHPSPRGQVIYWHGNGGNLSLWLDVFADIRRRGFSVLAVDYRGYGASGGSPTEKGIYRDAEAVIAHFTTHLQRDDTQTIYWGRSLGSVVASFAAGKSPPDALILESAFPDARSLFAGNPLMLGLSVFSTYRFSTATHLESYRGPLLIVHGDGDTLIPFSAGQKVFARAAGPQKTFAALKGVGHNDNYASHPDYWRAVDRFLANTD